MRKGALKEKSKKRDFDAGAGDIQRGMSLGAENKKEVEQCRLFSV
jgi:hypothetical protein